MKKLILVSMVGIGISLGGCGGNDKDHTSKVDNGSSSNDPVLKETLSLTSQSQASFEQAEPKRLTEISETGIDHKAEPVALKF